MEEAAELYRSDSQDQCELIFSIPVDATNVSFADQVIL